MHPEDKPWVMQKLNRHLSGESNFYEAEHRLRNKTGEYQWIQARGKVVERDSQGNPKRAVGTHVDISERKSWESEIRKLKKAVEESPLAIFITDRKGNIEYTNAFLTEMTGYLPHEIKNKNMRIFRSGMQPRGFYKNMWNVILSGQIWKGEFRNRKKNGELYWESATIAPLKNEDGVISHFVSLKEDITEKKRTRAKH